MPGSHQAASCPYGSACSDISYSLFVSGFFELVSFSRFMCDVACLLHSFLPLSPQRSIPVSFVHSPLVATWPVYAPWPSVSTHVRVSAQQTLASPCLNDTSFSLQYPTRRTLCSSDRGCKKGWMDPQSKGTFWVFPWRPGGWSGTLVTFTVPHLGPQPLALDCLLPPPLSHR